MLETISRASLDFSRTSMYTGNAQAVSGLHSSSASIVRTQVRSEQKAERVLKAATAQACQAFGIVQCHDHILRIL